MINDQQLIIEDCLILVVDDNPNNLQLIGNILRAAGYRITFSTSGTQALDRIKIAQPNLILLDLMMPDVDGLEVCRRLRNDVTTSHIPIVFLTASHEREPLLEAFSLGAVDYITKPFNQNELLARLKTHLLLQQTQANLAELNCNLEAKVEERTQELQRALSFSTISQHITERVRGSLDEIQVMTTVLVELAKILKLDRCTTGIYDLTDNLLDSTATITCEYVDNLISTEKKVYKFSEHSEIYQQLCQGLTVHCKLPPLLPLLNPSLLAGRSPGLESITLLACPLRDEQQIIGDLWLYRFNQTDFSDDEICLVESIAAQSAIALRQARLYQATQTQIQELERLNYAKNDFLKSLSHELKTPLTTIKAASDTLYRLLKGAELPDKRMQIADQSFRLFQEGYKREISLINNLLELVYLDVQSKLIDVEAICLDLLVSETVQLFMPQTQQQNQTLTLEIIDDLPDLETDPNILERILSELLHNACKYTPAGESIKVTVKYDGNMADDGYFQLSIANKKVGLSEINVDQLFEKFYRLPQPDQWQHSGLGLGLALVKKQTECLGGTVKGSYENQCFTVTVRLPKSVPY